MCGVPAARITPSGHTPDASVVQSVVRDIQQAGRRPVLLAANASELRSYHGLVRRVMALSTREDSHALVTPPWTTKPLKLSIWMWEPAP